jgi:uncharacterized protein
MEYLLVIVVALAGACLSFFSGFGLGTLLLPAFMVFFPLQVAVAATAVVHMLNNLFKLFLVGKYADKKIIFSFGLLSIVGAVGGAWCLKQFAHLTSLYEYNIGSYHCEITTPKLVIAVLIIVFSLMEVSERFSSIKLPSKALPFGGLISGFFGGLSGHQGALRSAFLMKAGLSKEAFMGTRVVCACMVDVSRISVYASEIGGGWRDINPWLVISATLAAFTGAWLGNKWMKKKELGFINRFVTVALLVFAVALGVGVV